MTIKPQPLPNSPGWWVLSKGDAHRLACGHRLPPNGYELLIDYQGQPHWLALTIHDGRTVWTLRSAVSAGV